jgi:N-ethylmaleimide reductase
MIEPRATTAGGSDELDANAPNASALFRKGFQGKFISAGGYTKESGEAALEAGLADAIAYGRIYIANPDLAERFAQNAALNPYDRASFYGGDEKGYTDYPSL